VSKIGRALAAVFLHPTPPESSPITMKNPIEGATDNDSPQQIILFRSKLTDQAGEDYQAVNLELESLVRQNPGFVDVKSYTAADGERLTVVWWRDEKSLADWRNLVRHREAQNTGRQKWYQYYKMDVASITRSKSFERK
jgi:heme-degrading monooxygenase HmoA